MKILKLQTSKLLFLYRYFWSCVAWLPFIFQDYSSPLGKQHTSGSNARTTRWRTKESFKLIPLLLYYNQLTDSISKGKTGSSAPSSWGTVSTRGVHALLLCAGKAYKPSNTDLHKNNLLENTFNAEIHMVGWKEWWSDFKTTKILIEKRKIIRFQKVLLMLV